MAPYREEESNGIKFSLELYHTRTCPLEGDLLEGLLVLARHVTLHIKRKVTEVIDTLLHPQNKLLQAAKELCEGQLC